MIDPCPCTAPVDQRPQAISHVFRIPPAGRSCGACWLCSISGVCQNRHNNQLNAPCASNEVLWVRSSKLALVRSPWRYFGDVIRPLAAYRGGSNPTDRFLLNANRQTMRNVDVIAALRIVEANVDTLLEHWRTPWLAEG